MIGLEITGLVRAQKMFSAKGYEDVFQETTAEIGNVAEKKAKQLCPVDDGVLIDSIFLDIQKNGFVLGATAPHAVFNEYGCYNLKMGPAKYKGQRPFLRPALYFAQSRGQDIFGKKLHKLIDVG